MKLSTVLGGIIAVICFFFAVIFGLAASVQATSSRLVVSGILFLIGVLVIAGVWYINRRPKTIVQRLEVSGRMSAAQIKCPHCGGSINADQIQITQGVPYVDVVKYSGATETFDLEKLRASVKRAGASDGNAQRVARNVEIRVRNAGVTPTEQIREWVIIELMTIPDYYSAEQYSAYRRHESVPLSH